MKYSLNKSLLAPIIFILLSFTILSCSNIGKPKTNVIFITVDTTRADHLGFYGNSAIKTPALDALAKDSVVFNRCYSTTHSTIPAHTSMFTSLYLKDHGVTDNGGLVLPDFKDFMPTVFQRNGYKTAGFTSGGHLSPLIHINQGFDDFFYPDGNELIAEENNGRIFQWLEKNKENPFFIWTHFFDPHRDYLPPAPFDKMYQSESDERFSNLQIKNKKVAIDTPQYFQRSQDPEYYRNLYKGEISYLDEQIGKLIQKLKDLGLYEKSIIVLVADHGEYLGEHSLYFDHRGGIYDQVVHVPMLIKTDHQRYHGFRQHLVSIIDIYPTITELLKLDYSSQIRGKSLVSILESKTSPPIRNRVYYESSWRRYAAVKTEKFTFIREMFEKKHKDKKYGFNKTIEIETIDDPTGRQMLFDNTADKEQENNLVSEEKFLTDKFEKEIQHFSRDILHTSPGVSTTSDKKHLEKLKALGYIK